MSLNKEKLTGLLFVLALHGVGLYGLWSYRIIPTPVEAMTLMVSLINPPAPELSKPKQPKPEPPKPVKTPPPERPHEHLVAEAPVVLPTEPVAYVPSPPVAAPPAPTPPPAQVLPTGPVMLSGELSVTCPGRTQPNYPLASKRMNEQGKVVLRVALGENGQVDHAEVKTSSGYKRLDDAALSAVRAWSCKPAMRNGAAVQAVALQPFNFILEER